jgi:hypothetical protein
MIYEVQPIWEIIENRGNKRISQRRKFERKNPEWCTNVPSDTWISQRHWNGESRPPLFFWKGTLRYRLARCPPPPTRSVGSSELLRRPRWAPLGRLCLCGSLGLCSHHQSPEVNTRNNRRSSCWGLPRIAHPPSHWPNSIPQFKERGATMSNGAHGVGE